MVNVQKVFLGVFLMSNNHMAACFMLKIRLYCLYHRKGKNEHVKIDKKSKVMVPCLVFI